MTDAGGNRTVVLALVLAFALGGATALDVVSPPRPVEPDGRAFDLHAGVLACPFAVADGARSLIHVANVGDEPGTARLTVRPQQGKRVIQTLTLAPGSARTIRLDGRVKGPASAVIDHAGGDIVASHSLWYPRATRPGARAGAGAATCGRAAPSLAVAHLRTLDAESYLALTNPSGARVSIDVAFIFGNQTFRPAGAEGISLGAGATRIVRVGDSVFDARDVTAVVSTGESGSIVAEGMVSTRSGLALTSAQEPGRDAVVISGRSGPYAFAGIASTGSTDVGLRPRLVSASDQARARGLPSQLAPGRAAVVGVPVRSAGGPAALVVEGTPGGALAAGTSWLVVRKDDADIAAAEAAGLASRWGAVVGSPFPDGTIELVLMNPGSGVAQATVTRTGSAPRRVTIEPGRLIVLPLAKGAATVGVEVESDAPLAAAVTANVASPPSGSLARLAYGFGLASAPLDPAPPVAVISDPRAGVPAPLGVQ